MTKPLVNQRAEYGVLMRIITVIVGAPTPVAAVRVLPEPLQILLHILPPPHPHTPVCLGQVQKTTAQNIKEYGARAPQLTHHHIQCPVLV